jgi:hypothetical protein
MRTRDRAIDVAGSRVRRYLTQVRTKLSSKGQLVLPAQLRRQDRIAPGDEFVCERLGPGDYRLTRREPPANEGLVDCLLACPAKGYFVTIESESTDRL